MPKRAVKAKREPVRFLYWDGIAELTGKSPTTIKNRYYNGRMPEPDVFIDEQPGWSRETILAQPWAVPQ
jgi:predicted DNA-binding transcriptional regulator AlpA